MFSVLFCSVMIYFLLLQPVKHGAPPALPFWLIFLRSSDELSALHACARPPNALVPEPLPMVPLGHKDSVMMHPGRPLPPCISIVYPLSHSQDFFSKKRRIVRFVVSLSELAIPPSPPGEVWQVWQLPLGGGMARSSEFLWAGSLTFKALDRISPLKRFSALVNCCLKRNQPLTFSTSAFIEVHPRRSNKRAPHTIQGGP